MITRLDRIGSRSGWSPRGNNQSHQRSAGVRGRRVATGFSLIELLVVLSVTVLLTSMLFPAFRSVRESAQRLACASNMRQVGLALTMYSDNYNGLLPESHFSSPLAVAGAGPRELLSASLGPYRNYYQNVPPHAWTGLAQLLPTGPGGGFLESATVLFSPSYTGEHTFEKYRPLFEFPGAPNAVQIITNYHFCGHIEFGSDMLRRLRGGHELVLVATGMRVAREMNQRDGTNVLRGDCAVTWFQDSDKRLFKRVQHLETNEQIANHPQAFAQIWAMIAGPNSDGQGNTK